MSEELEIIDNIRQKGFRPQVVGCFVNDNKILLLFHKKYKLWQLPQGGINNRETVLEALKREMEEELGVDFIKNCDFSDTLITEEAQLIFPKKHQGSRELKTDEGQEKSMKGKRYFFLKINARETQIDLKKTEFDDYLWLNKTDALKLAQKIYQKGKREITLKAITSLGLD